MIENYTITIPNKSVSSTWGVDTTHYCNTFCTHTWYPYYSPITIYKYQVKCPKCKTNNWLELEKITSCTKCSSTLKAVSKSVDYEVEVGD